MSIFPWHARQRRARFGNEQAITRCGEPVQLQPSIRSFACHRAAAPVIRQGHIRQAHIRQGHGRLADGVMME